MNEQEPLHPHETNQFPSGWPGTAVVGTRTAGVAERDVIGGVRTTLTMSGQR